MHARDYSKWEFFISSPAASLFRPKQALKKAGHQQDPKKLHTVNLCLFSIKFKNTC